MTPRVFPIQSQSGEKPHPTSIPWEIADLAYSVYSARYGKDQSLELLAERGGFGPGEMDMFLPDWRDRCSAIESATKALREENECKDRLIRQHTQKILHLENRIEAEVTRAETAESANRALVEALRYLISEDQEYPDPIIKHWSHTASAIQCPRCLIDAALAAHEERSR